MKLSRTTVGNCWWLQNLK